MADTKNKLPFSSLRLEKGSLFVHPTGSLHPTGRRCGTCALMLGMAAPDTQRK